jgi:hypothetical protein
MYPKPAKKNAQTRTLKKPKNQISVDALFLGCFLPYFVWQSAFIISYHIMLTSSIFVTITRLAFTRISGVFSRMVALAR